MKQGSGGTAYYLWSRTYYGGSNINRLNLVTNEYTYPQQTGTIDDASRIGVQYSYDFWSGTDIVQKKSTTLPAVPTSQNGSNTATTTEEYYDNVGRLRWKKDGEGYVTYCRYVERNALRAGLCKRGAMAMVEPLAARVGRREIAGAVEVAYRRAERLGESGEGGGKPASVGGVTALREPRATIWQRRWGAANDSAVWSRFNVPSPRSSTKGTDAKRFLTPFPPISTYGPERGMKSFWTRVQTATTRGLTRGDRGYPPP